MSFYEYIQTFKDDKTPLGELAIWIKRRWFIPKTREANRKHFVLFSSNVQYRSWVLEIVKRSLSLYDQLKS